MMDLESQKADSVNVWATVCSGLVARAAGSAASALTCFGRLAPCVTQLTAEWTAACTADRVNKFMWLAT